MVIAFLLHGSVLRDSRVRREAKALVEAGHQVTLLEAAPVPGGEEQLDGFRRRSVLPAAWTRLGLPLLSYRVVRGILAERPDAIHAHDAAMLLPGLIGRRLTGAALVYETTGPPSRHTRGSHFTRGIEALARPRCVATIAAAEGSAAPLTVYDELPARDEARLQRVYSRYLDDKAKRRAWRSGNPGNRAIRSELLAELLTWAEDRLEAGAELLDVGCGTGWLLQALAKRGIDPPQLTGIDRLPDRSQRAQIAVPGATVLHGDAASLPFPANSYDLVTLMTVLSSIRRPSRLAVLRECARVLRPGGLVLIYEPRVPNPLNRATSTVSPRELKAGGLWILARQSLTVAPPIARRLGTCTPFAYPILARVPAFRSHWLIVAVSRSAS